jgi:hypothetical protein
MSDGRFSQHEFVNFVGKDMRQVIRIVAMIGIVGAMVVLLSAVNARAPRNATDWLIALSTIVLLVVNLIALAQRGPVASGESWLGLEIEARKTALRKRIAQNKKHD